MLNPMIDFRFHQAPLPVRSFAAQFEHEVLPESAYALLVERWRARPGERPNLVAELGRFDDESMMRLLDGLLRTREPESLELTEALLVERELHGLAAWLDRQLSDELRLRWWVDILGELPDPIAARLLLRCLEHPLQSTRRQAADALLSYRSRGDGRALVRHLAEPLVRRLAQPDPLVAVRALQRLADPALEPDFGRDIARRAERVLVNCVRHDPRDDVRGDAIAALGEIGSRTAVRCLVDMLHRDESRFHREVVIALRKIHPDRALMALLSLLRSSDPIVREEAASALGEIGDPKAAVRLRALLHDPSPDVRQEAVLALGKLGGEQVLEALERALSDSDAAVRTMACHALAECLGTRAVGKLIGALYDGSADVRSEAAYHLGNLGDENARRHLLHVLCDHGRDVFGERVGVIARRALWRLERKLPAV